MVDGRVLKVYVGYERYDVGCVLYEYLDNYCGQVVCLNNAMCNNTLRQCVCTSRFYGQFCQWGKDAFLSPDTTL